MEVKVSRLMDEYVLWVAVHTPRVWAAVVHFLCDVLAFTLSLALLSPVAMCVALARRLRR